MIGYKATPVSTEHIIEITQSLRKILGYNQNDRIDIIAVLEYAMPQLYKSFNYVISADSDMKVNAHAYTNMDKHEIVIREDVYERARMGKGRDRFTIAHEIGHYILHSNTNSLTRVYANETIKAYENLEWQANAFAGELLCPSNTLRGMEINEIAQYYGVSIEAAKTQKKKSN